MEFDSTLGHPGEGLSSSDSEIENAPGSLIEVARRKLYSVKRLEARLSRRDERSQPRWYQPAWQAMFEQQTASSTDNRNLAADSVPASWNLCPSSTGSGEYGTQHDLQSPSQSQIRNLNAQRQSHQEGEASQKTTLPQAAGSSPSS